MSLHHVDIRVCDPCLDGIPDECHTPGCAFFIGEAPSAEVGDRLRSWANLQQAEKEVCGCYNCSTQERRMTTMIVCPTCGNKRCPRSTDHRLDCTGSNASGQPGSRYR